MKNRSTSDTGNGNSAGMPCRSVTSKPYRSKISANARWVNTLR